MDHIRERGGHPEGSEKQQGVEELPVLEEPAPQWGGARKTIFEKPLRGREGKSCAACLPKHRSQRRAGQERQPRGNNRAAHADPRPRSAGESHGPPPANLPGRKLERESPEPARVQQKTQSALASGTTSAAHLRRRGSGPERPDGVPRPAGGSRCARAWQALETGGAKQTSSRLACRGSGEADRGASSFALSNTRGFALRPASAIRPSPTQENARDRSSCLCPGIGRTFHCRPFSGHPTWWVIVLVAVGVQAQRSLLVFVRRAGFKLSPAARPASFRQRPVCISGTVGNRTCRGKASSAHRRWWRSRW